MLCVEVVQALFENYGLKSRSGGFSHQSQTKSGAGELVHLLPPALALCAAAGPRRSFVPFGVLGSWAFGRYGGFADFETNPNLG